MKKLSPTQQRYRGIIAKALHDKGDCGYDYGTWEEMAQSGAECACYEKSDWIVAVIAVPLVSPNEIIRMDVQALPSFGVISIRPFDYMISRNKVLAILDKYATRKESKRVAR